VNEENLPECMKQKDHIIKALISKTRTSVLLSEFMSKFDRDLYNQ
jgi:hypothetical protein